MATTRVNHKPSKDALMVSISGIRGISGTSLVPHTIEKYVGAFAKLQAGKRVVVGRDSRVSGPWVERMVAAIMMAWGYEVIDVGIVPTPTVLFMTEKLKADAGIVVTSSHNPIEWNGLKFADRDGLFLKPDKCKKLFAIADAGDYVYPGYQATGSYRRHASAAQEHIDAILALDVINVDKIKQKKYKIVLDSVNGAGGEIMQALLTQLGCEVIGLNLEMTGRFAHKPEPVPEHLGDLCKAVKKHGADLGIAVDPDVDRCVLIDEAGNPLGEEYTLALACQYYLGVCGKRGPVCKNLSTSRAVDDIAKQYNCPVYNAPVGEIQVATVMIAKKAVIGGEGNGGVMLPEIHSTRDAPIAAAITLAHLAHAGTSISKLKATLPLYDIAKHKAPIQGIDPDAVVAHFKKTWQGKAELNDADGLRIDTPEWWVHLRKSNTEPIVRVIGEAGDKAASDALCKRFMDEIIALRDA